MPGKPKRPVGRPVTIDAKRVTVTLDESTIVEARKLGDGNLSEGLRLAVRAVASRDDQPND